MPAAIAQSAKILIVIVAAVSIASYMSSASLAGKWKGEEVTKEGILHVMNPATPMESSKTFKLKELWRIGGDTDDEDEFFGVIGQILVDDKGNVYLLDSQLSLIKIFNKNGEFIREIGREGEGPGEFRRPTGMFFTKDGNVAVMQVVPGKIVILTPEGEPAGEYPLPPVEAGGFQILLGGQSRGDNVVLAIAKQAFSEGRYEQMRYLCSIDPDGSEKARYHEETRVIDFADPVLDDAVWNTFDRRWGVGWNGRVYAATSFLGYKVNIWSRDGKLERVIEVDQSPRKRTQEEKDLVNEIMSLFIRQIPNGKVSISDLEQEYQSMYLREDGSLWVLPDQGPGDPAEGTLGTFDVFDREGHFLRKVTLQGEGNFLTDGYFFVGDRLYVVTDLLQAALSLQAGGQPFEIGDEEPEPMAVICYELDKDLKISMK